MNGKMLLIILFIIGQLGIYIFAFLNLRLLIACIILSILAFIVLFGILIYERLKEKEEDKNNDYRDY